MKKVAIVLTLLIVILGLLLYLSPVLRQQVNATLPPDVSKKLGDIQPQLFDNKTKPLYKWKNNKGEWIVSDKPPGDGTRYETLQYNPDSNVIPAESISGKK